FSSSRKRTSTLRFVILLTSTSRTWLNWKSESANRVSSRSFCSTLAELPLKSKRVMISLFDCLTAFFTSTMSASQTTSNDGMVVSFYLSVTAEFGIGGILTDKARGDDGFRRHGRAWHLGWHYNRTLSATLSAPMH